MDANYNDVQEWKYKDLVDVFGADPAKSKTYQIRTKREAENLFQDGDFASASRLQVSHSGSFYEKSYLTITVCGAIHAFR